MRKTTLTGQYAQLADIAGGVSALAEALGVSEMSLWRWNNGVSKPSGPALSRIRKFAAAHEPNAARVTCVYCTTSIPALLSEPDHVVPRSRGGDDKAPNVVPCCLTCNRTKRDRLPSEWMGARAPPEVLEIERTVCARITLRPRNNGRAARARSRPAVVSLLSEKAFARLVKLAHRSGLNRSAMVESLIMAAPMPPKSSNTVATPGYRKPLR